MKGNNVRKIQRNKWEQEMYEKLYQQKLEDERTQKITRMLEYVCMVVIALGIIGVFIINRMM